MIKRIVNRRPDVKPENNVLPPENFQISRFYDERCFAYFDRDTRFYFIWPGWSRNLLTIDHNPMLAFQILNIPLPVFPEKPGMFSAGMQVGGQIDIRLPVLGVVISADQEGFTIQQKLLVCGGTFNND